MAAVGQTALIVLTVNRGQICGALMVGVAMVITEETVEPRRHAMVGFVPRRAQYTLIHVTMAPLRLARGARAPRSN